MTSLERGFRVLPGVFFRFRIESFPSRVDLSHSRMESSRPWIESFPSRFGVFSSWSLFLLLTVVGCSGGGDGGGGGPADAGGGRVFATLEFETAHPGAFGYLSGVRELPDGSLLAADPASVVLLRLDMEAGRADTLGRTGEGPEEYKQPDHVFPLPGDSSLLVDLGNGRLTVMDPDGAFVRSIPMVQTTGDGSSDMFHPSFVDERGGLYEMAAGSPTAGPPDSVSVIRADLATGQEDTVAWLWRPEYRRRERGAPRPILTPRDDWAVAPDGSVAVVRANGFSVDWYRPDGGLVRGPSYPVETFPVGEAEKAREVDLAMSSALVSMVTAGASGIESRSTSRGVPSNMVSEVGFDAFDWPESLPPFQTSRTLVSPWGEVWVARMMPAEGPGRMDVFDGEGVRQGHVELPPSSKVIGFGDRPGTEGTVYLVRTDEFGLEWLERYRIVKN